jgi:hypothetical protein
MHVIIVSCHSRQWGIQALASNQYRKEAGLVYLLAVVLWRRTGDQANVNEAVQWLNKNGFRKHAYKLITLCSEERHGKQRHLLDRRYI